MTRTDAVYYQRAAKDFEQSYQQSKAKFSSSSAVNYYIVSKKFINEWVEFCRSEQEVRQEPSPLNEDIVDPEKGTLRKGLSEGADFEILSSDTTSFFGHYGRVGHEMPRRAYLVGQEKKVPIYLDSFPYIALSKNDLRDIESYHMKLDGFKKKLRYFEESASTTFKEAASTVHRLENLYAYYTIRFWKISAPVTVEAYFEDLCKKIKEDRSNQLKIVGLGKRIEDTAATLEDLNLGTDDFLLAEIYDECYGGFLIREGEGQCDGCNKVGEIKLECPCKKAVYCSQHCKDLDFKYHSRNC